MTILRAAVLLLISIYVAFILDLALLQFPSRNPGHNPFPFHSIIGDWKAGGREFVVNFVGNIVAFVPIGMMPALARRRWAGARRAALFCLTLSAIIEVAQYITGRRTADVDDLILNTLGGVLGDRLLTLAGPRRERIPEGAADPGP